MKKNLFYLFIALFAVTSMTACGDDDDDKDIPVRLLLILPMKNLRIR